MQTLNRAIFETSRQLEFFSEKELSMQIGHGRRYWPQALLKELIDNGLDACESAGIEPHIMVSVEDHAFTVQDNGPGLPADTLKRSLDFMTRVSDKAYYVSPSRGQLGNALKTVWAAPFVAHGARGCVEVWSQGLHHTVEVSIDRIAQKPAVLHTSEASDFVKNGTLFKIHWQNLACSQEDEESNDFYKRALSKLAIEYTLFNHHTSVSFEGALFESSDPTWRKWSPNDPTSPHWYTAETLRDLIGAYISRERDGGRALTIREFVSQFRGLASTAKQKQITGKLAGSYLHDMVSDGNLDLGRISGMLCDMQEISQPVKPDKLGLIGGEHWQAWMMKYWNVSEHSFKYARRLGNDGMPYAIEVGFGISGDPEDDRHILTGLNWSPTLSTPTETISYALGEMRIDDTDPVCILIHMARPRFDFTDRGKTRLQLSYKMRVDLESAIKSVAKEWKRKKLHEDRVSNRELERMCRKSERTSIREAAFDVMEMAYLKASSNGVYPAESRQIYYCARPAILQATGKDSIDSPYFTQTLIKDYMEKFQPEGWDVVFDDRGHISEPHTGDVIGLGGIGVREYIERFSNGHINEHPSQPCQVRIDTAGPSFRYGAVLFIEKEGFDPLLKAARIAERFDVAIASTKGMPVSALCDLLLRLEEDGIKAYVLHDFDKSGFSIVASLRNGTRGSKGGTDVIDIGLRLEDIAGLERERVSYGRSDPRQNLRDNGATKEEIAILVSKADWREYEGERCELNAMTSGQLIEFIERKLTEHGIKKVIPESKPLEAAYRRAVFLQRIQAETQKLREQVSQLTIAIPEGLESMVREGLRNEPDRPWDEVLWGIANKGVLR